MTYEDAKAFDRATELVPAPEGQEWHCNGCSKALEYETSCCDSCEEPMGAYLWVIGDEPSYGAVLGAAAELSVAADRFEQSIHETLLIADIWRTRLNEQQRQYWMRKDQERMFR